MIHHPSSMHALALRGQAFPRDIGDITTTLSSLEPLKFLIVIQTSRVKADHAMENTNLGTRSYASHAHNRCQSGWLLW